MTNAIDFPGGNLSNNIYNSSGSAGQPNTSRACNSVHAGWRQPLTSSLVHSSYWGKTARHHSSGPQPLLPMSILARMASFVLSPYVPPRESSSDPLPKFASYRVKVITHSVSVLWVGQCVHTSTKFLCFLCLFTLINACHDFLCFAMLRNISTGSETRVRHAISDVIRAWCSVGLLCWGESRDLFRGSITR